MESVSIQPYMFKPEYSTTIWTNTTCKQGLNIDNILANAIIIVTECIRIMYSPRQKLQNNAKSKHAVQLQYVP